MRTRLHRGSNGTRWQRVLDCGRPGLPVHALRTHGFPKRLHISGGYDVEVEGLRKFDIYVDVARARPVKVRRGAGYHSALDFKKVAAHVRMFVMQNCDQ